MPLNGKKVFGAGRPFATANIANATPIRFLLPQDQSITFKRGSKSIFGENQMAADVSGGELEVSGKVTYGGSVARVFGDLLFNAGSSTGQIAEADNELCTIASHAFTVANGATFAANYGVRNTTTGAIYQRVAAAAETAGVSYSVNTTTGVYTFNASETGTTFKVSYTYTVVGTGETVNMTNMPMGKVQDFTATHVFPWTNNSNVVEQDIITLLSCIATDADISSKGADYGKPTFSFAAACDANDNLGNFYFAEAS